MTTRPSLYLQPRLAHNQPIAASLSKHYPPTLARILAARGVLSPDDMDLSIQGLLPASSLHDITRAVDVIDEAIDNDVAILVVGDFDCDGATSTALMVRALGDMNARVQYLVPDRFKFGYGLTSQLVHHAKTHYNPKLIITVDNGISSFEGVEAAAALGIDVVITDHHLAADEVPDAKAVVNPNQSACHFASKSLVGVGVAFYVMGSLAKKRRLAGKSTTQVSQYLDLVALGTVADVGVLDKNNRILVAHGLHQIKSGQGCFGIMAILAQAGRDFATISASDFGFAIAPRINAAGRMDNMKIGVECLLSNDFSTANQLAKKLNELNVERRQVESQMKQVANQMLDGLDTDTLKNKRGIVLYQDDWHQGVIGIVAGRIKESTYTPTIIFAPADVQKTDDDDYIKGSARSIAGVHIRDVIVKVAERYPDLICYFGGHAMAAGLTIYKRNFDRFVAAFDEVMNDFDAHLFNEQKYTDGNLLPTDFSLKFAHHLKHFSIWGQGFVLPSFDNHFKVLSFKILKDKHLKISLELADVQYPIDAIWFNYDASKWDYRASCVHILFTLDINEWQGNEYLQLIVQDLAVVEIQ